MKVILRIFSLVILIFFVSCNTASNDSASGSSTVSGTGTGTGTFDLDVASLSKFDVMVSDYLNADKSGMKSGRSAIGVDVDQSDVAEAVTLDVWLKSSSENYATFFKANGSMQEKAPAKNYIAQWYLYEEGEIGTTLGTLTNQTRLDRISVNFPKDTFADGTKKASLLLRVYDPDTTDTAIDKVGVQAWRITFSKTNKTLDLSALQVDALNINALVPLHDANSGSFSNITSLVITANATHFTTAGSASKPNVTLKTFKLLNGTSADLHIMQIKGTKASDPIVVTSLKENLLGGQGNIQDRAIAYNDNVRVDYHVAKDKRGLLTLTIADNKYGIREDVVVELRNNIA